MLTVPPRWEAVRFFSRHVSLLRYYFLGNNSLFGKMTASFSGTHCHLIKRNQDGRKFHTPVLGFHTSQTSSATWRHWTTVWQNCLKPRRCRSLALQVIVNLPDISVTPFRKVLNRLVSSLTKKGLFLSALKQSSSGGIKCYASDIIEVLGEESHKKTFIFFCREGI